MSIICYLFFLSSFVVYSNELKGLHLVRGCDIFTNEGKLLRTFPGGYCAFLDDGSYVSVNERSLKRINHKKEILWEHPYQAHHMVNLSVDKKNILVLFRVPYKKINGAQVLQDMVAVLNLNGKILHKNYSSKIFADSGVKSFLWHYMYPTTPVPGQEGVEISHFNSIYEIPVIKRRNLPDYLKEGNFIVNGLQSGTFILSADLKSVLHSFIVPTSYNHKIHDVQISNKGNYLYFNNQVLRKDNFSMEYPVDGNKITNNVHSSVEEADPVTMKVLRKFEASPKEMFYSVISGGVQELNEDTWLFTHFLQGTYVYSWKNRTMKSIASTHVKDHKYYPTQDVKAFDLGKFLSFWAD